MTPTAQRALLLCRLGVCGVSCVALKVPTAATCDSNLVGSHLLGAFLGGLSFCWMKHHAALNLWHSQVKRIAYWLIRLFFGATVAFSIPITKSAPQSTRQKSPGTVCAQALATCYIITASARSTRAQCLQSSPFGRASS